ncbi:hypothetical protein GCM10027040_13140 [Halomonas shantousis]
MSKFRSIMSLLDELAQERPQDTTEVFKTSSTSDFYLEKAKQLEQINARTLEILAWFNNPGRGPASTASTNAPSTINQPQQAGTSIRCPKCNHEIFKIS